jgi:hypothetical protein
MFRKLAIAKTLINEVVIDIEGCDKHEIEAFVKSFNLACLKTNFRKFSIQNIFEIWVFKKATFLDFWKKSPKLFIIVASHMENFILGSECWKFGLLDMEWPTLQNNSQQAQYKIYPHETVTAQSSILNLSSP